MKAIGQDSLQDAPHPRRWRAGRYQYFSIPEAAKALGDASRLPVSLKVLLENVLRFEDGTSYKVADAQAVIDWLQQGSSTRKCRSSPRAS